ncbi:hypothetical protein WT01_36280 [Burkholderia cepacia]|nr:hypothetical protein WT01_36280 [Burkholderia cepacia]
MSRWTYLGCVLVLAACNASDGGTSKEKPARTEVVAHETELLRLILAPEAQERLGLKVEAVGIGGLSRVRTVHGEVVAPPLMSGGLPIRSASDLAALAANQVRADGDVERARAELDIADKATARADALVREEAGSVRVHDEALSARAVAKANLDAAKMQRRLLGSSVASLGQQGLWVRAAALASDLTDIDRSAPATLRVLGEHAETRSVQPVQGPASADPVAGTVDLYYRLDRPDEAFRFGQRVSVDLPLRGNDDRVSIPTSAILRDIYGGEWAYAQTAPYTYERRRIEVAAIDGGNALLGHGLLPGTEIVTVGAAELFSTEFGAK